MHKRTAASPATTTTIIVGSMLVGLIAGGAAGPSRPTPPIIIGVLSVQTLLTVGALPRGWYLDRSVQRDGRTLVLVHHLTSTLPLLLLAAAVSSSHDLSVGLIALAIVPIAAGAPMYAAAAGVDPRRVAAATVLAYALSIVLTPLLAVLTLGQAAGFEQVVLILVFGLVAPTLVALTLQRWVIRVPALVRFLVIGVGLFVIAFCYGGTIGHAFRGASGSTTLLVVALAIGVVRGPACAALAVAVARRSGATYLGSAAISGGYKNITLSAGIALSIAGPVAAAPSIGGFLGESTALGVIAWLHSTRSRTAVPAAAAPLGRRVPRPALLRARGPR